MSKENNSVAPPNPGRRGFFKATAATAVLGGLAAVPSVARAQAPMCPATGSVAWMQPENNNAVIAQQERGGGAPDAEGEVLLEYFGHCAFRITSPRGVTMMFDPWRNDPSGAWGLWYPNDFPKTRVDIGLSTHAHFDHDALDRLSAPMLLDRMAGEYRFADVKITGVADKHACMAPGWYNWTNAIKDFGAEPCPPDNPGHMDMSMYAVETGGLRIVMWGDNRHNPSPDALRQLGEIDILTLPVDGSRHILSYEQGNALVEQLNPKMVIPTHYLCEGVSITLTTLETADEWVAQQKNRENLTSGSMRLHPGEVRGMRKEFKHFGANTMVAAA